MYCYLAGSNCGLSTAVKTQDTIIQLCNIPSGSCPKVRQSLRLILTLREEPSQINVNLQHNLPAAKLSAVYTAYKQ